MMIALAVLSAAVVALAVVARAQYRSHVFWMSNYWRLRMMHVGLVAENSARRWWMQHAKEALNTMEASQDDDDNV